MKRAVLVLLVFSLLIISACHTNLTGSSTAQFCAEREKASIKDDCFRDLGVIQKDLKICDQVEDTQKKFYCYEKVAEAKNNQDICYQIDDNYWSSLCFKYFAVQEKNSFPCLKVTLAQLQEDCFEDVAYATNDPKLCQALSQEKITPCLVKIAKATGDFTVCDSIDELLLRDQCIRWVALEANDSAICSEVSLREIRENCYEKLNSSVASEINLTEQIENS